MTLRSSLTLSFQFHLSPPSYSFSNNLPIQVSRVKYHRRQFTLVGLDELLCFKAAYHGHSNMRQLWILTDLPRPVHTGYLATIFYECNLVTLNQIPSVKQQNLGGQTTGQSILMLISSVHNCVSRHYLYLTHRCLISILPGHACLLSTLIIFW
jgi:hypothetical protein